jgi:hypothetical protein
MPTVSTLYGYIHSAFHTSLRMRLDAIRLQRLQEDDVEFSTHTPIHQLLSTIFYLPYDIRKFLLDFARIQNPIKINKTLLQAYVKLSEEYRLIDIPPGLYSKLKSCGMPDEGTRLSLDYIVQLTDNIYDNPILCSLLSYFVRAERTAYPDEFVAAGRKVIDKELAATQLPNRPQQLDYTCLYTNLANPIHEESAKVPKRTIKIVEDSHRKHDIKIRTRLVPAVSSL